MSLHDDSVRAVLKRVFGERELSEYQKIQVDDVKIAAAIYLHRIETIQRSAATPESARLFAMAKSEIENSALLAVKAISRQAPGPELPLGNANEGINKEQL